MSSRPVYRCVLRWCHLVNACEVKAHLIGCWQNIVIVFLAAYTLWAKPGCCCCPVWQSVCHVIAALCGRLDICCILCVRLSGLSKPSLNEYYYWVYNGYRTSHESRTYANKRRDSEKQRQTDWVECQSIIIYFRHMAHKK